MSFAIARTHRMNRLLAGALLAAAACQGGPPESAPAPASASGTAPKPAEIANEFAATAQVVAIAPAARSLTLRREDDSQFEVKTDESVRNFDQIKVGDTLRVRYRETLAVRLCGPGEKMDTVQGALVAGRAPLGEKPGAGVGAAIRLRVKIESIDRATDIVAFSLPSGELIARRLQTPQGREFVRGLVVGDIVQLDITSMLALAIETMK